MKFKHALRKSNRGIHVMQWPDAIPNNPRPNLVRVLIPYSHTERLHSNGKCAHVQYVRQDSMRMVAS